MQVVHENNLSARRSDELDQLSRDYRLDPWKEVFKGSSTEDRLFQTEKLIVPSFFISFGKERDFLFRPREDLLMNPSSRKDQANSYLSFPSPSFTRLEGTRRASSGSTELRQDIFVTPDFTVFRSDEGGLYEPISIDYSRTPQQRAALRSMLEQSIKFLFGNSAGVKPAPPMVARTKKSDLSALDAIGKQEGTLSFLSIDVQGSRKKRKREGTEPHRPRPGTMASFRSYQTENWDARYEELIEYRKVNFHCCVPYDYPPNRGLARWVKRQRYQYKLYIDGQSSAMTPQRLEALENIGFLWDAHTAAWERRLIELKAYRLEHGNCIVPSTYRANRKLASWVKCQRRHYKLYQKGLPSTMTEYRVEALNELGFAWEVRTSASSNNSGRDTS